MKRRCLAAVAIAAGFLCAQTPLLRPGPLTDGSELLATGWPIHPSGQQIPLGNLPTSSALSPDGRFLLVLNGGSPASVSVLRTEDFSVIANAPLESAGFGLAFAPDGRSVYVAGGRANAILEFSFSAEGALAAARQFRAPSSPAGETNFLGHLAIPPGGRLLYATDLFHDRILLFNPQTGQPLTQFPTGRRPYQILFHPDGASYFVSSWADASIYQHRTEDGFEMNRTRVAPHPMGMAIGNRRPDDLVDQAGGPPAAPYRLFVTAANTNNVMVVSVDRNKLLETTDLLNIGFAAGQPAGMTPSALALTPDQEYLLVVCSDTNTIAVADVRESRSRLAGFLPVGAYPTGARVLEDGRIAVLNGGSGSLSVLEPLSEDTLGALSDQVLDLVQYRGLTLSDAFPAPIEHVVMIVENGSADGPADEGPNHAKLASEFLRLDNYYPASVLATEGEYWLLGGFPPPFTRLLAPKFASEPSPLEGGDPANLPPAGLLWTNAIRLGVRNYGFFVENAPSTGGNNHVARVKEPPLEPLTDLNYRGFDPTYPDSGRAQAFLADLDRIKASGNLPALTMLRMNGAVSGQDPSDHDRAFGMIVDGLSHSRFWANTAIVVVPANGTGPLPLYLISPFTRGAVAPADGAMYTQSAVLRTVEEMLGLRPLTLFDASAEAIAAPFTGAANPAPYELP